MVAGCSSANVVRTVEMPVSLPPPNRAIPTSEPILSESKSAAVHLPPLLLHLPGIGGRRSIDVALVNGFRQGGFKGDVQIYDWTHDDAGIDALRSLDRNKREATLIARSLVARHVLDPTAVVYLTCHSGGAGIAAWVLEDLPPGVQVRSVLFMSPALSPDYDLTAALRHVATHAYAFTSLSDTLILGYGTRVFGTIDGVKTDAAGRVGFRKPPAGDGEQYAKLVQLPYEADWVRYHNYGDHVGGMTRIFAATILAPLTLSGILPATPASRPSAPVITKPVSTIAPR